MKTSDSTKNIMTAILSVQGQIEGVKRDSDNLHFKSRYATLEAVIDTIRPSLQSVGVAFMQFPGSVVDGALEVTTTLFHPESGEWISNTMQIPLGKRDPQGAGSALTYSMRYSLMAMLGLPPVDDDGEGAMERGEAKQPAPKKSTSAAEQKRGLEAIDDDLIDCHTLADVNKCAKVWASIMDRDNWSRDYREIAIPKFAKRRTEIEVDDEIPDFPGDRANGAVSNMMAGE